MAQVATEADIASTFLKELGAPDTDLMRKAVTAWLRKESGSRVIGNNPWNISLGASKGLGIEPISYRVHSRTGQKFAVYASPADGTKAAARLLLRGAAKGDWRNYQAVVNGARSGDPIRFLNGLASSAWSADRYGGPKNNSLLRVYAKVSGLKVLSSQSTPPGHNAQMLSAFGGIVSFPEGHILTEADVDTAIKKLTAAKFFDQFFSSTVAANETRKVLMSAVGKPWGKPVEDELAQTAFAAADEAAKNPLEDLGLANLVDPGFWARILALIAGAALVGFGTIRLAKT